MDWCTEPVNLCWIECYISVAKSLMPVRLPSYFDLYDFESIAASIKFHQLVRHLFGFERDAGDFSVLDQTKKPALSLFLCNPCDPERTIESILPT